MRSRFKLNLIAQIEAANLKKPPLDPAVRAQLVERYRSDVLELQDLIGRDLSHWLT